jgi:anti-sigma regulatory factor (Ser/Thr protein kinase)
MNDLFVLQVRNDLAALPAACEALSQWLAQRDVPPAADYLANLALEELVTNCIKYGYDDALEHTIEVEVKLSDTEMVFTLADDGHAFNPLDLPEPDLNLPVGERSIGGLGIHLLRKMSSRVEYSREQGKNRVSLYKTLGS